MVRHGGHAFAVFRWARLGILMNWLHKFDELYDILSLYMGAGEAAELAEILTGECDE